jgi:hypothetical protein
LNPENCETLAPNQTTSCLMTHPETLQRYRRMTNQERAEITCRLIRDNWPALFQGPPEVVDRRFERLRQENDRRNRNMLTAMARTKRES